MRDIAMHILRRTSMIASSALSQLARLTGSQTQRKEQDVSNGGQGKAPSSDGPAHRLHNELKQNPQRRDTLYRDLARTEPGLIHHLEQLRQQDEAAERQGGESPAQDARQPASAERRPSLQELLPAHQVRIPFWVSDSRAGGLDKAFWFDRPGQTGSRDEALVQALGGLPTGIDDWIVDHVKDGIDAVTSALGEAAGLIVKAGDLIEDLGKGLYSVTRNGVEFVVDTADKSIDVIGDGVDALKEGVAYAVENGLKLTGKLLEYAIDAYRSVLSDALNLKENIAALGPGDSFALALDVEVALGLGVQAGSSITVTAEDDGTYTVTGQFSAEVEVKAGSDVSVGGGGTVTFKADSPEEAQQLALIMASGPKPSELGFVKEHLQSVELSAQASVEFANKLGIGDVYSEATAELNASSGVRIEFENGEPVAIVLSQSISAEATVTGDARLNPQQLALQALLRRLGIDVPDNVSASIEGEFTVETRIPIDSLNVDVKDILEGNIGDAIEIDADQIETSVRFEGQYGVGSDGELSGKQVSLEIEGLQPSEALKFLQFAATGDPGHLDGIDLLISGTIIDFDYEDHSPIDFGALLPIGGISVETESSITDVDPDSEESIDADVEIAGGDASRPRVGGGGGGGGARVW
jgi:hypothetical protein